MVWHSIIDGDDGIASDAMDNWKWAGRMALSSFYPMNGSGAYAVQDFGETGKEWGDLYLETGATIYVGGVAFSGGGGGSASGLDVVALANNFDKQGMNYPLTSDKIIRNAFTDDTNILCYLRTDYSTADTTTILLDHGLDSELETIDDMETHADWTAGTNTPTVAADAVNYIEGSESVKLTKTVSGDVDAYASYTLSLTDRLLRVSAYPDTITGVTELYVILYTSSGNQRKFSFANADLTAAAWNHLTCDLDDSTAYTDTGTFERSAITRIYLGWSTSSSVAVNVSWDSIRAISNKPLLVPDYGLTVSIQDATNQETLTITDEDTTNNLSKGSFTINATLSNNYTADASATYLSNTSGYINNKQFRHNSTASGQEALTAKQIEMLTTEQTISSATLEAFARFYHESYEVTDFPSTSTIDIESATDTSGYFLDNDYILLYKKLRAGYKDQSMEGSYTTNYLRLQLNANATYSSTTITLSHDGSNSIGSDTTGYYVVPESVAMAYSTGAKTASTFTTMTPTELIANEDSIPYPSGVYSHWKLAELSGNAIDALGHQDLTDYGGVGSTVLDSGRARGGNFANGNPGTAFTALTGDSATVYDSDDSPFMVEVVFRVVSGSVGEQVIVGKGSYVGNTGWVFLVDSSEILQVELGGTIIETTGTLVNDGNEHYAVLYLKGLGTNEMFVYMDNVLIGQTTRAAWTTNGAGISIGGWNESTTDPDLISDYTNGYVRDVVFHNVPPTTQAEAEYYISRRWNNGKMRPLGNSTGYTLKYKEESLTNVDKAELITTLDRNDTTNQEPILYETGAILY